MYDFVSLIFECLVFLLCLSFGFLVWGKKIGNSSAVAYFSIFSFGWLFIKVEGFGGVLNAIIPFNAVIPFTCSVLLCFVFQN